MLIRNITLALVALVFTSTLPARLLGQASGSTVRDLGHDLPVPRAVAAAKTGPIVLDGRLDEQTWSAAAPITEFVQFDPDEGKPASERTEVRILYGDDALYIGARMFDRTPSAIHSRLVRRDADMQSDYFQVVIDAFHDHLGRAFFQVNPAGSKFDALGIGASNPDDSWDGIWEAATRIDSLGWVAEMRVPYSQLRFSRDPNQVWGLQIRRFIHRRNEESMWSFWHKNESGGPARFGHLDGVKIASVPRHLEVLPYVVTRSKHVRPVSGRDPFNDGSLQNARAGADLKYSVTSNLQLSATLNPDFGQVEVDPAVVNLSQYETFFQEKRPFFVEGAGVFGFGSFSCYFCSNVSSIESFYSRRIGRAPSGLDLAYDRGQFVDAPDNSTIVGAAKLTGRTKGGYTLGLMDAYTRSERASVFDTLTARSSSLVVEPSANYFVGRLKRDYLNGNLVVGAIGTSLVRSLDSTYSTRMTRHAELAGIDMLYTFKQRRYSIMSQMALSNVAGDTTVIASLQRSPARYLQRPDRSPGAYDPTATSLQGFAGYARVAKDGGDFNWEAAVNTRTVGYEVNDMAFLRNADYYWMSANVLKSWNKPTRWYRNMATILGTQQQFDYDGDRIDRQFHSWLSGRTLNFWNWSAFIIHRPWSLDDKQLRGGPVSARPGSEYVQAHINTDSRKALSFGFFPGYSWNFEGGWGFFPSLSADFRPKSNVLLSFGPSYSTSTAVQQYVTSVEDPAVAPEFAGRRYVMSGLDQRVLSLDTRMNWTFTPVMTFELFVQPFIASGHYFNFKEFDRARSTDKSIYGRDKGTISAVNLSGTGRVAAYTIDPDGAGPAGAFTIDNPDFNTRSLRGNAVFRWEYRPGSTLFLVWTQSRATDAPTGVGDFRFTRDREELFAARPDNIFLVKVNYWLAR
ncbi:MAG TPA: DUF5916 domain-containing protein [Gemmatimonadaceae bacterium]|nr:DUF5916 domain-containing protein [Gemmatimonadaceae bacterium]